MAEQEQAESINFSAFVLSLATTAAVHFGDLGDPASGEKHEPDLVAAGQMIDILALLQDKTRGNLDRDEEQLLSQVLYELRMRFVEVRDRGQGQKRIILP
jgi:hypothetical protein